MFAQVAHLVICEDSGDAADFAALTEHVAERLHVFPAYRRRLAAVPFGLDHPGLTSPRGGARSAQGRRARTSHVAESNRTPSGVWWASNSARSPSRA